MLHPRIRKLGSLPVGGPVVSSWVGVQVEGVALAAGPSRATGRVSLSCAGLLCSLCNRIARVVEVQQLK
jgi:hypothetical protein